MKLSIRAFAGLALASLPLTMSAHAAVNVLCLLTDETTGSLILSVQGPTPDQVKVQVLDGLEDGQAIVSLSAPDIQAIETGAQKLNLLAAHHNTVIRLVSDARFFGDAGDGVWNGVAQVSKNLGPTQPREVYCQGPTQ